MTESTYYVLLQFTQEGPFTCAELRERLLSGKARSYDRLVDGNGQALMITDLIPDAADLSLQRPAVSDHIRRTSRQRHGAIDSTRKSPTPPPQPANRPRLAPLPERSPAVAATPATALRRPVQPSRRRVWFVLLTLLVVCSAANLWLWVPRAQEPLPPQFQPPAITPLTRAELKSLPKNLLLPRVFDECTRRMFADRRGLRAGPQVLPAKACPLWVAGVMEPQLLYNGLTNCLSFEHITGTPSTPSLAQLADAYATLGLAEAAQALREALAIDAAADSANGPTSESLTAVKSRLTKALGKGSDALRNEYANKHRLDLFTDLP